MEKMFKILTVWYAAIAAVCVLYANFDYLKRNSFSDWLFLGEVTSTAKGVAWPYFIYKKYQKDNEIVLPGHNIHIHKKNIASYRIIGTDEKTSKDDLIEMIINTWKTSYNMSLGEEVCLKNVLNGKFMTRELRLVVSYSNSGEKIQAQNALDQRREYIERCMEQ